MIPSELDQLEDRYGLRLPTVYRECVGLAEGLPATDWDVFITDLWAIIEDNDAVRELGFFGLDWPAHYFVVGNNGAGNLYYLDTSERDQPRVYEADHEIPALRNSHIDWFDDNRLRVCFMVWMEGYRASLKKRDEDSTKS